jgi:hypothetical protein
MRSVGSNYDVRNDVLGRQEDKKSTNQSFDLDQDHVLALL